MPLKNLVVCEQGANNAAAGTLSRSLLWRRGLGLQIGRRDTGILIHEHLLTPSLNITSANRASQPGPVRSCIEVRSRTGTAFLLLACWYCMPPVAESTRCVCPDEEAAGVVLEFCRSDQRSRMGRGILRIYINISHA